MNSAEESHRTLNYFVLPLELQYQRIIQQPILVSYTTVQKLSVISLRLIPFFN